MYPLGRDQAVAALWLDAEALAAITPTVVCGACRRRELVVTVAPPVGAAVAISP